VEPPPRSIAGGHWTARPDALEAACAILAPSLAACTPCYELKATLADHAAGNYRVMMNLADELVTVAADRELPSSCDNPNVERDDLRRPEARSTQGSEPFFFQRSPRSLPSAPQEQLAPPCGRLTFTGRPWQPPPPPFSTRTARCTISSCVIPRVKESENVSLVYMRAPEREMHQKRLVVLRLQLLD
jgi:hypothetical protein